MRSVLVLVATASLAGCALLGMHDDGAGAAGASAHQDAGYLHDISQGNLETIAAARLAVAKGQSLAVKRFGRWMLDEHAALEAQAEALARTKGFAPPSGPDLRAQAVLDQLQALASERFESAYLQQTVEGQADMLQVLDAAASRAHDARLRMLAVQAAVHARQHLAEARRLAGDMPDPAR